MKTIICADIVNNFPHNNGQYLEQRLTYTLTGHIRRPDHIHFDRGSDIPEYNMSVKSSKATIVSAALMHSDNKEDQIEEYFARVKSTSFAYVAMDGTAYIMNAYEFRQFLLEFVKMQSDSSKNGGGRKMRLPTENKAMLRWLNSLVG